MAKKPAFKQAFGRCSGCGRVLARGMTKCTTCKAKRGSVRGALPLLLVLVVAGAAYWKLVLAPAGENVIVSEENRQSDAPSPRVPAVFRGWLHYATHDAALGDEMQHDRLLGTGPDGSRALLELTSSAQYGRHVMISFRRVKQACQANPCSVAIAWDDSAPVSFGFTLPASTADGGMTIQTDQYDRFVAAMKTARKAKVILSLGMAEDYVVRFEVGQGK